MAVVGHASENLFLPDTAFVGQAKARTELAHSLAGRNRVNYELLTGTNPFPDEQHASPMNPQRKLGHDHSGAPFGAAFLHPVCGWSWEKANAANVIRPTRSGGVEAFEEQLQSGSLGSRFGDFVFWNRPHTRLPEKFGRAPYSILVLYIVAHKKAADAVMDIKLTVGESDVFTDSVTIDSANVKGFVVDSGTTPGTPDIPNGNPPLLHLPAVGGRNKFLLEFTSTASAANALTIDAWYLCQVRKLRWLVP